MRIRNILCVCAVLACAFLVAVPFVTAADASVANARDDPQLLSGLKSHVAYYGELQLAQMEGTIRYVNIISNGTGIYTLQNLEEDYLISASTIPLLDTADDITSARDTMQTKTSKFSAETQTQMLKFNGKAELLNRWVNTSVADAEGSIQRENGTSWLASNTSRLNVFNIYSTQRENLLKNLENKGLNVTEARDISSTIDAQRSALKDAVLNDKIATLKETNTAIIEQNQEFRNLIAGYQSQLQVQAATA
ncbi:MAG: hypothetical protein LUQ31_02950 [Methanoregula sp.]|nr:hypothetical protein [Methanoregula sp.]